MLILRDKFMQFMQIYASRGHNSGTKLFNSTAFLSTDQ
jgi:hypothetical protein